MNPEILISCAAFTIEAFACNHECSCVLGIAAGKVIARTPKEVDTKPPRCLVITRFEQVHGLTNGHWQQIGAKLMKMYKEEKQCQNHPKP